MRTRVKPSKKLRELAAEHKSLRLAALAWGVQPDSLERFFSGVGCINVTTAARIIDATGYGFDALFVTQ